MSATWNRIIVFIRAEGLEEGNWYGRQKDSHVSTAGISMSKYIKEKRAISVFQKLPTHEAKCDSPCNFYVLCIKFYTMNFAFLGPYASRIFYILIT